MKKKFSLHIFFILCLLLLVDFSMCRGEMVFEKSARENYERSLRLIDAGQWQLAEKLLIKAREMDPDMGSVYVELGNVYFHLGKFDLARENLTKALEINDCNDRAYYFLSSVSLREYKLEKALGYVNRAIEIDPYNPRYHFLQGSIYMTMEKYHLSAKSYRRTLKLEPLNYSAAANLSVCYLYLGELEKALKLSKDSVQPKNPPCAALLARGIVLWKTGHEEEGYRYFEEASETFPECSQAFYNMGIIEMNRSNLGGAEFHLKKAIELSPGDPLPHVALGKLFRKDRRYKQAEEILKKSVDLNPGNYRAHLELGILYVVTDRADLGRSSLEKAVLLQPDNALVRNALGSAYQLGGMFTEALEEFKKASLLNPDLADVYFNIANVYEDMGKPEKAVQFLKKYLKKKPGANDREEVEKRIKILKETSGIR